jgi:hypothetical protein
VQEELAVSQLASPLAYFFISHELLVPRLPAILSSVYRTLYHSILSDTSSHMVLHAYIIPVSSYTLSSVECFMSIGAGFGNRNSDRDYLSCPEEGEVRPWFARWSCSLRNVNVR